MFRARKTDSGPRKPSQDDVRAQLERILASPGFTASAQRRNLLRYLVDEALAGQGDRLKGFVIAVAVFGRDESFDAQADPLVRVEAMRLRRELDMYYGTSGTGDPVRISIPKGAYVPAFAWCEGHGKPAAGMTETEAAIAEAKPPAGPSGTPPGPSAPEQRHARSWLGLALAGFALALALMAGGVVAQHLPQPWMAPFSLGAVKQKHGITVVVLPFRPSGGSKEEEYLAFGFAQQLTTALTRFAGLDLYSAPLDLQHGTAVDPVQASQGLPIAYLVDGRVRSGGGRTQVDVELLDAKTGRVLWGNTFDRQLASDGLLEMREGLAGLISTELGQPYGIIRGVAMEQLADHLPPSMVAYGCVLRAYAYRRTFSHQARAQVRGCLEETVRLDPRYADAFALLSLVQIDTARFENLAPDEMARELQLAFEDARRSVELAPRSALGLQALGAAARYRGRHDEAERRLRQAVELSPDDPEALAQLGWHLVLRGKGDEGRAHLARAIGRSLDPPPWYYFALALEDYMRGEFDAALDAAGRARADDFGGGWSLYAIIQAARGNRDEAANALSMMTARAPDLARDADAWCVKHGFSDATRERFVAGLRQAGWKSEPDRQARAE